MQGKKLIQKFQIKVGICTTLWQQLLLFVYSTNSTQLIKYFQNENTWVGRWYYATYLHSDLHRIIIIIYTESHDGMCVCVCALLFLLTFWFFSGIQGNHPMVNRKFNCINLNSTFCMPACVCMWYHWVRNRSLMGNFSKKHKKAYCNHCLFAFAESTQVSANGQGKKCLFHYITFFATASTFVCG